MRIDTKIVFEKSDVNVHTSLEPALNNLWGDEAFRGQILQLILKELAEQGFKPSEIEWVLGDGGYVLSILVGSVLKALTKNAIYRKVIPFVQEQVRTHRDFKPAT